VKLLKKYGGKALLKKKRANDVRIEHPYQGKKRPINIAGSFLPSLLKHFRCPVLFGSN
jgi:hypothetical protein